MRNPLIIGDTWRLPLKVNGAYGTIYRALLFISNWWPGGAHFITRPGECHCACSCLYDSSPVVLHYNPLKLLSWCIEDSLPHWMTIHKLDRNISAKICKLSNIAINLHVWLVLYQVVIPMATWSVIGGSYEANQVMNSIGNFSVKITAREMNKLLYHVG